jgi:hypothetical protein
MDMLSNPAQEVQPTQPIQPAQSGFDFMGQPGV